MPDVSVTRTYLEMHSPTELVREGSAGPEVRLEPVRHCPWHFYRYLYVEVGRLYHWKDRLPWSEAEFREWLAGPSVVWLLSVAGAPAGFFELRAHPDNSQEIAYFGVLPEYQGKGLGKWLLTRAVEEAWATRPALVKVNTCTLDHPGALPNYLKRGFKKVGEEVYVTEVKP